MAPTREERVWKVSQLFGGAYEASNDGLIRRTGSDEIRKQFKTGNGYQIINVFVDGKHHTGLVHRLVASAFIPNPDQKKEVNHIDGNKQNNNISNLEWVTPRENIAHARMNGLIKESDAHLESLADGAYGANLKRMKSVRRSDGIVFRSIADAATATGCSRKNVANVANGDYEYARGYGFEWVTES